MFAAEIATAEALCKAPRPRLLAMASLLGALDAKGIAGDVVECGVWKGGHAILSRLISPDRVTWLYDTFDGMPKPALIDGYKANRHFDKKAANGVRWNDVSLAEVRDNLVHAGVYDETKLRFVVGNVCQTLKLIENIPRRIAFLRLDTDWYKSTRMQMKMLYPALVKGGILMVDDYGHWPGCRVAIDEYFGRRDMLKMIDYTCGFLIKS